MLTATVAIIETDKIEVSTRAETNNAIPVLFTEFPPTRQTSLLEAVKPYMPCQQIFCMKHQILERNPYFSSMLVWAFSSTPYAHSMRYQRLQAQVCLDRFILCWATSEDHAHACSEVRFKSRA
jgi:hypothetical protein